MKRIKLSLLLSLIANLAIGQSVIHTYDLLIVNPEGTPIKGATIDYEVKDDYTTVAQKSFVTDETGKFTLRVPATLKTLTENYRTASTMLTYKVKSEGYFPSDGLEMCNFGSSLLSLGKDSVISKRIVLEPSSTVHRYLLKVFNIDEKPLSKATVHTTLTSGASMIDTSFVTSDDGTVSLSILVHPEESYTSREYSSKLHYEVSLEGFYSNTGDISSNYGNKYYSDDNPKVEQVRLTKPIDYFKPKFASSKQSSGLKKNILKFIDLIRLESILSDAILEYQSIELVDFKAKKYLQIKFSSTNSYNSLKLDKYDIAKRLFDEVVRKVLNPLNNYITDPKIFFGYDVTVIGYTKDFSEKYASSHPLEYRFLMPESAVRSYKNKDISGQQLLDKSIILLDDERIDLKLQ